jgi:hypothetical protein
MKPSAHTKVIVWGYCLVSWCITKELEEGFSAMTTLGWAQVAVWAISLFLIPTVLRLAFMYPAWGWLSLGGCVLTIAFGPIVPAQLGPWILYLAAICVSGAGAYLFLIDSSVSQYASQLQSGGVNSKPHVPPNDGPAE